MNNLDIIGANLFLLFLLYYYNVIKTLFKSGRRKEIKIKNSEIEELRKIKVKSVEEQKRFIDLKYPKTIGKTKYDIYFFLNIIKQIIIFIVIYKIFFYIINYYNITIKLYIAITLWIIFPLILNYILKKYNLHNDDTLMQILKR